MRNANPLIPHTLLFPAALLLLPACADVIGPPGPGHGMVLVSSVMPTPPPPTVAAPVELRVSPFAVTTVAEPEPYLNPVGERPAPTLDNGADQLDDDDDQPALSGCRPGKKRTTDFIAKAVRMRKAEVDSCYLEALRRDPGMRGRIDLTLMVERSGKVAAAEATRNTVADPLVGECVVRRAQRWRFPKSGGDAMCRFNYPFFFASR